LIHAQTVAKQNAGVLSLVDTFITPNANQLTGEDRKQLDAAVEGLRKAVAEQQAWLDKTLVPNAKGNFRIGQKLYDEKLQFALMSSLSRAEIKQRAESELTRCARADVRHRAPGAEGQAERARLDARQADRRPNSRKPSKPRSNSPTPTSPSARTS
jgi:hypothetical protein